MLILWLWLALWLVVLRGGPRCFPEFALARQLVDLDPSLATCGGVALRFVACCDFLHVF